MQIGIVGLPNVGKSTLFNALTKNGVAEVANYPFCTIDPNTGIVEVPDHRLAELAKVVNPEKIIPAIVEFVDIAGLVKGASTGEGLGNKFLANIRECDAIAQVVRIFNDDNIIHVHNEVNPKNDIEIIELELIMADLQTVEKRIMATEKEVKANLKNAKEKNEFFKLVKNHLESGKKVSDLDLNEEEQIWVKECHFLSIKPILYIANVKEEELTNFNLTQCQQQCNLPNTVKIVPICAKLEADLAELTDDEAQEFLDTLGIKETGRNLLIREAYSILNLETYFTAGVKEVRAWTFKKNSKAPQCAGIIHTDFEKGFICVDIIHWQDFVQAGGESKAKEKGFMKMQGRDYTMKDGDVCHFKFNR